MHSLRHQRDALVADSPLLHSLRRGNYSRRHLHLFHRSGRRRDATCLMRPTRHICLMRSSQHLRRTLPMWPGWKIAQWASLLGGRACYMRAQACRVQTLIDLGDFSSSTLSAIIEQCSCICIALTYCVHSVIEPVFLVPFFLELWFPIVCAIYPSRLFPVSGPLYRIE